MFIINSYFIFRYDCISSLSLGAGTSREKCVKILGIINTAFPPRYQLGKTKIFLCENLHQLLEEARFAKLNRLAVVIQAKVRALDGQTGFAKVSWENRDMLKLRLMINMSGVKLKVKILKGTSWVVFIAYIGDSDWMRFYLQ